MKYSKLLSEYIERSNMTLEAISKGCRELGVEIHPTYVSKLRTGSRQAPSEEISRALATVTGGDPEELIRAGYYDTAPDHVQALMDRADLPAQPFLDAAQSIPIAGNLFPIGRLRSIPIVTKLHSGDPYYTQEHILGFFPIDASVIDVNSGDFVWMKVQGDSMLGAGIYDGSLVLIRLQSTIEDGDIAAVCVGGDDAQLRRVSFLADAAILQPENPRMKPATYERSKVQIIGKAMKVVNDL